MGKKKTHLIIKFAFLSFCLAILLKPSLASAQTTQLQRQESEQQKVEQAAKTTDELNQALFTAVANGLEDEVAKLLSRGADVNARDARDVTPLYRAVMNRQKNIVELLVANGADISAKSYGKTPIDIATMRRDKEMVEFLSKIVNISSIRLAVQLGKAEKVKAFLEQGADINAMDEYGDTLLHLAVGCQHNDVVELLIDKGLSVNARDKNNATPLYIAVGQENKEMVSLLINKGADVNVTRIDGSTPLNIAVIIGDVDIVKFLVENGAKYDVNFQEEKITLLHHAAFTGDISRVKELVEQGTKIDAKDKFGWTALNWAVSLGHTEVAEFLINNNADIRVYTRRQSDSLLHQAVQSDSIQLVELLISKGINVNVINRRDMTPLHLAIEGGHKNIVELLITKGADLSARNNADLTPLDIATSGGRTEIVELLKQHGAKKGGPVKLLQQSLPELKDFGINLSLADVNKKKILVCFFDMQQRPSRNCINQLAERAEQLRQQNILVVGVQASEIDEDTFKKWIQENNVTFPVGILQGDKEDKLHNWGVRAVPWLILTDSKHIVTAEGFGIDDLDEKINAMIQNK